MEHLTFDCSGAGTGFDACKEKAAGKCGAGGYKVIFLGQTGDAVAVNGNGNTEMKRTLVVACN